MTMVTDDYTVSPKQAIHSTGEGGYQCPLLSHTGPKADTQLADILENSPD